MSTTTSTRVLLVGHCGPDSSFLRMAVKKADPAVQIVAADDDTELSKVLVDGVDLILFNRELGYGFEQPEGVAMIARLRTTNPKLRMMLVSNYTDAQQRAVQAGGLPGFGKREIGQPWVTELLKSALYGDVPVTHAAGKPEPTIK
jgi:hypothetical protein